MAKSTNWSVPRMWESQPCVIFASGESMSQEVADRVRQHIGFRTIVINDTVRLAPWADMLYSSDAEWWAYRREWADAFQGLKVSCDPQVVQCSDVLKLKSTGDTGFDPDPANVRTGRNSGYVSVHIAAHAGCSPILLCGFDMRPGHWHGTHCSPLREPQVSLFPEWIANFETLAPELSARGIEVWNCTPSSKLTCFPYVPLDQALNRQAVAA